MGKSHLAILTRPSGTRTVSVDANSGAVQDASLDAEALRRVSFTTAQANGTDENGGKRAGKAKVCAGGLRHLSA